MKEEIKQEIKFINQVLIITSMIFTCLVFLGIGFVIGSANFDKYKFCIEYMYEPKKY